ncbi:MAG: efflux RND transporter periplasmic adaptor subunit [Planctomycetaceae bacterium]|nr:efflux RND transporter periplasmic adaptor subunit [Planctomycetaceae bacterium]
MRHILPLIIVLFLAGCQHNAGQTPAANGSSGRKILYYQCPMDPQVTSQDPKAKCTVCGMKLGPVYADSNESAGTSSAANNVLKLSAATASVIGIETMPVQKGILQKTLRVAGFIVSDETKQRVLSARVPGRIEKLYVNQVGIDVRKNQPLAEIYSPDVLTAQRLYLENYRIIQSGTGAVTKSELASSREKLLAFGLEESDIQKLEETGEPKKTLEILAPFDGTVISRNAYEGQYVDANSHLFDLADLSVLWFVFDAYESDLPLLKMNQKVSVTLNSLPNETVDAPITFIDPTLNEETRTAKVRVVLPNPQRRILNRQTANGLVHIEWHEGLLISRSAVLYTREKPVVYVAVNPGGLPHGNTDYQIREIAVGQTGDNDVEVAAGLNEGENVVTQAALLIDSQAQLMRIVSTGDLSPQKTQHGGTSSAVNVVNAVLPDDFITSVLGITSALSADKLDDYNAALPKVLEELTKMPEEVQKQLEPFASKLKTGKTLKEVRVPFEPFSNAVADVVRAQESGKRQAFIFQCPMSPVLGTARWIQEKNGETLNPFFGEEMLNCGSEIE